MEDLDFLHIAEFGNNPHKAWVKKENAKREKRMAYIVGFMFLALLIIPIVVAGLLCQAIGITI